jgi:predicted N-formylglutamate amidohydrolase
LQSDRQDELRKNLEGKAPGGIVVRTRSHTLALVTCEHGGNRVPADLAPLFEGMKRVLDSHRGYDPGALVMARALAGSLGAPLVASTTTRLVVDLNRSLSNASAWSEVTRPLSRPTREAIVRRHYLPYRSKVERVVAGARQTGRATVHFSSHSFTPVLHGEPRRADVGLLYDPRRPGEAALCAAIAAGLREAAPWLRVRRNYPYAGRSDGLASFLRTRYPPDAYIGVEIELNQAIVAHPSPQWRWLRALLVAAIERSLA